MNIFWNLKTILNKILIFEINKLCLQINHNHALLEIITGDLSMEIERETIYGDGFTVPCVTFKPSNSRGAVILVHGYGGSKEEILGLAWRIAENRFTTCAIDLRGHGEIKGV